MKLESIKFLHQIKSKATPEVMSLVNSIFYEEGHASEILERTTPGIFPFFEFEYAERAQAGSGEKEVLKAKCPSCGTDWLQMEKDLNSPSEWVDWNSNAQGIPPSGFMGKSERKLAAEILCAKCSECAKHFGR